MSGAILSILKRWKEESGAKRVIQVNHSLSYNTLTIFTSEPGYLIGKGGSLYDKYKGIILDQPEGIKKILFVETDFESL